MNNEEEQDLGGWEQGVHEFWFWGMFSLGHLWATQTNGALAIWQAAPQPQQGDRAQGRMKGFEKKSRGTPRCGGVNSQRQDREAKGQPAPTWRRPGAGLERCGLRSAKLGDGLPSRALRCVCRGRRGSGRAGRAV